MSLLSECLVPVLYFYKCIIRYSELPKLFALSQAVQIIVIGVQYTSTCFEILLLFFAFEGQGTVRGISLCDRDVVLCFCVGAPGTDRIDFCALCNLDSLGALDEGPAQVINITHGRQVGGWANGCVQEKTHLK